MTLLFRTKLSCISLTFNLTNSTMAVKLRKSVKSACYLTTQGRPFSPLQQTKRHLSAEPPVFLNFFSNWAPLPSTWEEATVLIFPHLKLNLQLSSCTSIFSPHLSLSSRTRYFSMNTTIGFFRLETGNTRRKQECWKDRVLMSVPPSLSHCGHGPSTSVTRCLGFYFPQQAIPCEVPWVSWIQLSLTPNRVSTDHAG